jgi:hypothetical protein
LREQKIVRFANHKLEIIDPAALIAAAGIDIDLLDSEDRVRCREPSRVYFLADRGPASLLPPGWMPIANNNPTGPTLTFSAKAA